MLVLGSAGLACAAVSCHAMFGQPLITSLKTCFGVVADKNIANILLILGNDTCSYRA